MGPLNYLTVQDMIWINHCVTGQVFPFRYDALEEATFFQYGYGASSDLKGQAARFLPGFAKMQPFAEGNAATGFVGFVTFLRANGMDLKVSASEARKLMESPAADWITSAPIHEGKAVHGEPDMHAIVEGVIADFKEALPAVVRS